MNYLLFHRYNIMSSANNDGFTYSCPIWMPFISFSCLIARFKNFNTMLYRVARAGILVLYLILEEKPSAFTIMMLSEGFSCVEPHFLYTHFWTLTLPISEPALAPTFLSQPTRSWQPLHKVSPGNQPGQRPTKPTSPPTQSACHNRMTHAPSQGEPLEHNEWREGSALLGHIGHLPQKATSPRSGNIPTRYIKIKIIT